MEHLTPRELEVLKLICEGLSSRRIAGQLGIAFKTAACHRSRIMEKAGVDNAVGLLRWAIRKGIISIDQEGVFTPSAQATGIVGGGSPRTREELAREVEQARSRYLEASRRFLEVTDDVPSGASNPDGTLRIQLPARDRRRAFEAYQRATKKLTEHD
jgi:DNA-binding CsgD family transcriptional regulator